MAWCVVASTKLHSSVKGKKLYLGTSTGTTTGPIQQQLRLFLGSLEAISHRVNTSSRFDFFLEAQASQTKQSHNAIASSWKRGNNRQLRIYLSENICPKFEPDITRYNQVNFPRWSSHILETREVHLYSVNRNFQ